MALVESRLTPLLPLGRNKFSLICFFFAFVEVSFQQPVDGIIAGVPRHKYYGALSSRLGRIPLEEYLPIEKDFK